MYLLCPSVFIHQTLLHFRLCCIFNSLFSLRPSLFPSVSFKPSAVKWRMLASAGALAGARSVLRADCQAVIWHFSRVLNYQGAIYTGQHVQLIYQNNGRYRFSLVSATYLCAIFTANLWSNMQSTNPKSSTVSRVTFITLPAAACLPVAAPCHRTQALALDICREHF